MVHDPARPAPWSGAAAARGVKEALYRTLYQELTALLEGESDPLANAANAAAAIYFSLPDLNWAGFYLLRGETLVLGPFQGRPACVRIPLGQGVCGTAAARGQSIRVDDVASFPGHIACDPNSRAELVVPVCQGPRLLGVLDLDSPRPSRFDPTDQAGCEALAALLAPSLAGLVGAQG
jgi:L-methionine (R)-S-oxide reductase